MSDGKSKVSSEGTAQDPKNITSSMKHSARVSLIFTADCKSKEM